MVRDKSVFPMLHSNPTRVWDTFAEPNNLNNTECSFHAKSGLITPYGVTSPKKQVNRRRLRMTAAQNLSFMGFRNTSPNPVGFFFNCQLLCVLQFNIIRSNFLRRTYRKLHLDRVPVSSNADMSEWWLLCVFERPSRRKQSPSGLQ